MIPQDDNGDGDPEYDDENDDDNDDDDDDDVVFIPNSTPATVGPRLR